LRKKLIDKIKVDESEIIKDSAIEFVETVEKLLKEV